MTFGTRDSAGVTHLRAGEQGAVSYWGSRDARSWANVADLAGDVCGDVIAGQSNDVEIVGCD